MSPMSKELREAMRQADALSPDEQLYLISHLAKNLRRGEIKRKPRRQITEFAGITRSHCIQIPDFLEQSGIFRIYISLPVLM